MQCGRGGGEHGVVRSVGGEEGGEHGVVRSVGGEGGEHGVVCSVGGEGGEHGVVCSVGGKGKRGAWCGTWYQTTFNQLCVYLSNVQERVDWSVVEDWIVLRVS